MKRFIKYLLFGIFMVSLLLLLGGCLFDNIADSNRARGGKNMLDGTGMVRQWTVYDLYNDWVEIVNNSNGEPLQLTVTEDTCTFYFKGNKEGSFRYTLPEGTSTFGAPEGEVYLQLEECPVYENLIYHEEELENGKRVPVISATTIELDGRGEVVLAEFVSEENLEFLPENFFSAVYYSRNDKEVPPTYVERGGCQ